MYVGPTGQAHASISSIIVIYDTQSSDHFPLSICIDISINNNNNVFNSYRSTPRYIQCNLIYEKKKNRAETNSTW